LLLLPAAAAGKWLAARLAFTRTNAAWAMVGHVLGLGDRHGENIMIDGLTGNNGMHSTHLTYLEALLSFERGMQNLKLCAH
jgi:hypothetical protein